MEKNLVFTTIVLILLYAVTQY